MTAEFEDPQLERRARVRAAWALGVLALIAIIVGAGFLLFGRGGTTHHVGSGPSLTGPAVGVSPPTTASSTGSSSSGSSSTTGASSSAGSGSADPSGDTGKLVAALNSYRSDHGVAPVSGSVTGRAKRCAAAQGDQSSCPSSYFWEPVGKADGKQVLAKIRLMKDGPDFLLDPKLRRIEVGWAHQGALWQCAVVAPSS